MSENDEKALVPREEAERQLALLSQSVDFPLDTETVDWVQVREAIEPQGEVIPCADLVGSTFALYRAKPFPSTQEGGRQVVYWCVGRLESGTVFNTVVGGQAVCDVLDRFVELNAHLARAKAAGDDEQVDQLLQVGAGRAWIFTLGQKLSGNGREYYVFE